MARYRALDALRGLCASMVVLFHLNADTHFHHFFRNGSAGVDLFFVLSGFVLSAAYGDRIGRVQDVYVLLIRRFGRMYPLHFVILMIWVADVAVRSLYAGTSQFQDGFSVESLIESLFLVQGFTTNQLTWNFPTWSISVEIWMNVVYFWLMWLGKAAYRPFEIVLFGSLAGLALAMTLTDQDTSLMGGIYTNLVSDGAAFLGGSIVFRVHRGLSHRGWSPPIWCLTGGVVAALTPFLFGDQMTHLGMSLLFMVVVLVFSFPGTPLDRLLSRGGFQHLGKVSYSIYLIHPFFWPILTQGVLVAIGARLGVTALTHSPSDGDRLVLGGKWIMDAAALGCLGIVMAASNVTYRYIEEPWRLRFNCWSKFAAAAPAAARAI